MRDEHITTQGVLHRRKAHERNTNYEKAQSTLCSPSQQLFRSIRIFTPVPEEEVIERAVFETVGCMLDHWYDKFR